MNSELIEKAAKAIGDASEDGNWLQMDEVLREWCRRDARAVLAVFEDAWSHEHTVNVSRDDWERLKRLEAAQKPTGDEREALAEVIAPELGPEDYASPTDIADVILAAGFRRPASPSPALGDLENHLGRTSEGTALLPALWALAGVSPEPSAGPFSSRHENGLPEPQTEPTRNPCEFDPQAEPTDAREALIAYLLQSRERNVADRADEILRMLRRPAPPSNDEREALIMALVHTVEYVGTDMLPAAEGWSWYDALAKYAPERLNGFRRPASPAPSADEEPRGAGPWLRD